MTRDRNLATVQSMYQAFGAGDIPGVLEHLDEGLEWSNRGPEDIPYFGVKHGRDGALAVFGFLAEHVDISVFDPHTMVADDTHAVALVHVVGTAKASGLSYDEETVHVFDFNADGQVVRFRDFQDTEAVARALRG